MNAQVLKERIINDNLVDHILINLGCHHIRLQGDWWRAARPDGDNINSVQVNKETLQSKIWTKGISGDIISIVEYIKELYFLHAMKWICDICGYDYYQLEKNSDNKEVKVNITDWLDIVEDVDKEMIDETIKPISEYIFNQYIKLPHLMFYQENVSLTSQQEFEIMFDLDTERIVIPIRDELGTLVGIKGRATKEEDIINKHKKYNYLYPTSKTKILYGLYKTLPYIQKKKEAIVVEGEKTVERLWGWDYKNCVALGSKDISLVQIEKLSKLNVDITIALDKDVDRKHLKKIINHFKFFTNVYVIYDKWNLIKEKDNPTDQGKNIFEELYNKKFHIAS